MDVFELSRGWKITAYIVLSLLLLFFVGWALITYFDPSSGNAIFFVAPVCLVAIGFVICGFLQVNEKVIMDNYSIRRKSRLINREILLTDIHGYRVDKNYVYILPHKGRGKSIRVSIQNKGTGALQAKLAARYPDLTRTFDESQLIYDEVIQRIGEKDIAAKLKMAKTEVRTLTGIAVALCVLSFLYSGVFPWLLCCCLPVALLLLLRHKGLVLLDATKENPLPSIMVIPLLVTVAQLVQADKVQMPDLSGVWIPACFIALLLAAMLWICSRYLNKKRGGYIITAIFMVLTFVGMGYGLVVSGNYLLDKSRYEYYETRVTGKRQSKGRSSTYYLTLQPWAHQPESEKESVSRGLYEAVQINDTVGIYYYKGAFNMPWYVIKSKQ